MTEKVAFNINCMVYVRLTNKAREYLREEYHRFWQGQKEAGGVSPSYTPPAYIEPSADAGGFSAFQFWNFMDKFGPIMSLSFDASEYFRDGTEIFFEAHAFKQEKPANSGPQIEILDREGNIRPATPEETARLLSDPIHPEHYGPKGLQVLDALPVWMTPEEYRGFLRGNVIKYTARLGKKDDAVQDAKKARHYLDLLIESLENPQ